MAPEQIEKPAEVDHRADIYSLGVVFYELLTGELPLGKFAPPSEKSAADPRLDGIVRQALEKERDRRQQSVGEMRTQVETIAAAGSAAGARADAVEAERVFRKSIHSGIAMAAGFVLLVIVGFSAFLHLSGPRPPAAAWASLASPRSSSDLAESYVELQKRPTAEVIRAGLSKPPPAVGLDGAPVPAADRG